MTDGKHIPDDAQPVAWTNAAQLGFLKDPEYALIPMAMWAERADKYADIPLYAAQPPAAPVETDAEIEALERTVEQLTADLSMLGQAVVKACDLLAERTYGNSARSPGHNARLVLERALAERLPVHPRLSAETGEVK